MSAVEETDDEVSELIDWIVRYGDSPESRHLVCRLVNNSVLAEREACAKIADRLVLEADAAMSDGLGAELLRRAAAAIRARKGTP